MPVAKVVAEWPAPGRPITKSSYRPHPQRPAVDYQKQSFLGWMLYNRFWFDKDKYGLTLGGGQINNPGRYLVLLPPINGATAVTGSAYFPEDSGPALPWQGRNHHLGLHAQPVHHFPHGVRLSSFGCALLGGPRRINATWRHHATPRLAARRTLPAPTAQRLPIPALGYTAFPGLKYNQEYAANIAAAKAVCAANPSYPTLWQADMRRDQQIITFAILVKF